MSSYEYQRHDILRWRNVINYSKYMFDSEFEAIITYKTFNEPLKPNKEVADQRTYPLYSLITRRKHSYYFCYLCIFVFKVYKIKLGFKRNIHYLRIMSKVKEKFGHSDRERTRASSV